VRNSLVQLQYVREPPRSAYGCGKIFYRDIRVQHRAIEDRRDMKGIWLVRHGETEWSKSGAHTGTSDIDLTERGRQQAVAIGQALRNHAFDLILASPLIRALETCRLAGFDGDALVDPNLREWEYGDFEGRTTNEIRADLPGWSIWESGVRNGESIDQVGERAEIIIQRVTTVEGNVLLFSHGHFLRILAARWLELPPRDGRLFALGTASISTLGYERDRRVIEQWNNHCGNDSQSETPQI
jgi:broad specificity phosphatase PhoE